MKSFKKVLLAICISLLVCLGIAITIFYIIKPDIAKEWFAYIVDFVNKPLPIVGVTTLAVLVFVWKLIITSNYGKARLNAYDNEIKRLKKEHEEYKNTSEKEKEELKKENGELKGFICHICKLSTNKKINAYGKELENYGKETIDSETETN